MALFGNLDTIKAQLMGTDRYASAFRYLEAVLRTGTPENARVRSLAAGAPTAKVELGGGAFALEQAYLTATSAEKRWESHRKYIDFQAIVSGSEYIEVADHQRLEVAEDLLAARDLLFYQPFAPASSLLVQEGELAVLFPVDAHKPGVWVDSARLVQKAVIKFPVA